MKTFIRALVLLALSASSTAEARDYASAWSLFPEAVAESVQVQAPKIAVASRPTSVSVLMGLPDGCYQAEVKVEHRDDFTHVLKPEIHARAYPCVQVSMFDYQRIDLGKLLPGEHRILVENVSRSVAPTTFWVASDVTAVATE